MDTLRNYLFLVLLLPSVLCLGTIVLPGDVYIEYVHSMYVDEACTILETETVEILQAVKWTLEQLNNNDFTPFHIGLRVRATCRSVERANNIALNLATEVSENDTTNIVGVLGAGYSSETEVISRLLSSLPEQYRLVQITYESTSASLSDQTIYKNLFRTIPTDDIQVKVMRELIKSLNWTYMAIVYETNTYGIGGVNGLLDNIEHSDICFPETIAIDNLNETYIEEILRTKVFKIEMNLSDPPISGILIFGSSQLSLMVLQAVERIQDEEQTDPNNTIYPAFLLSETSTYIEGKYVNISRGAFIPSPRKIQIKDFQDYLTDLLLDKNRLYRSFSTDTYLKEWYGHLYDCKPADTVDNDKCQTLTRNDLQPKLQSSIYSQFAIQAVGSLVVVIKQVHANTCHSTIPLCGKFFKSAITNRNDFANALVGKTINFDTDLDNFRVKEFQNPDLKISFNDGVDVKLDSGYALYEVFNHQICDASTNAACLRKVAEYKSNELVLNTNDVRDYDINSAQLFWPNIRKPQCPDGFMSKKCQTEKSSESMLFIEGDLYIVGIVPVHNIGDTPLQCGIIKQGTLDVVEAMRFVIDRAKTELIDANIGLIVIDSCNDPQIIQERVLSLHRLGVYVDGGFKQVSDKILGYVGGWSSEVSIALASLTSRLNRVQISYASTATELSKRSVYPYFLRIPSTNNKQAETLVKIIKALGGNYIQVLYSTSRYGEGGRDLIREFAAKPEVNICIANEIPVGANHKTLDIIKKLREEPGARFIVMFVSSFDVENIIDDLNAGLTLDEFLFIASEGLGKRQRFQEYHNLVGTITMTSELVILDTFKKYFETLQPDGSNKKNPWIREYMENYFNCYYQWSFDKNGEACSDQITLDESNYDIDLWAPLSQRAVEVLLMAASKVLSRVCGNTTHLCDAFDVTTYIDEIMKVRMQGSIGSSLQEVFDNNGDGTTGYFIYMVDQNGHYERVGFSNINEFSFQSSKLFNVGLRQSLISTCGTQDVCKRCFPVAPTFPTVSESNTFPAEVISVIVILGVICCSLTVVLCYICKRQGCYIQIVDGKLKVSNTYITPTTVTRQARSNMNRNEGRELPKLPEGDYERITTTTFIGEAQTTDDGGYMVVNSSSSNQHNDQHIDIK